jgi:hypothetical protein
MRLGLSPLKRLVLEVSSDQEATRFSDALLGNYGVPGLVVTTPADSGYDAAKAMALKESIASAFGNKNRGNVGVLTNGATMEQFGFDPQQMNLESVHRLPEERISAVLRVPAIIAGLGAGLVARDLRQLPRGAGDVHRAVHSAAVPLRSAVINQQLRPDFTSDRRIYAAFDTTDVRALQEDEDRSMRDWNLGVGPAGSKPTRRERMWVFRHAASRLPQRQRYLRRRSLWTSWRRSKQAADSIAIRN